MKLLFFKKLQFKGRDGEFVSKDNMFKTTQGD